MIGFIVRGVGRGWRVAMDIIRIRVHISHSLVARVGRWLIPIVGHVRGKQSNKTVFSSLLTPRRPGHEQSRR